jgi:hypothetical protein
MCFEIDGLPPDQQISAFPSPDLYQNVTYWQGFMDLGPNRRRKEVAQEKFAFEHPEEDRRSMLPLGQCPQNCSFRGACYKDRYHNDQPFCTCYHVSGCCCCWRAPGAGVGCARQGQWH